MTWVTLPSCSERKSSKGGITNHNKSNFFSSNFLVCVIIYSLSIQSLLLYFNIVQLVLLKENKQIHILLRNLCLNTPQKTVYIGFIELITWLENIQFSLNQIYAYNKFRISHCDSQQVLLYNNIRALCVPSLSLEDYND